MLSNSRRPFVGKEDERFVQSTRNEGRLHIGFFYRCMQMQRCLRIKNFNEVKFATETFAYRSLDMLFVLACLQTRRLAEMIIELAMMFFIMMQTHRCHVLILCMMMQKIERQKCDAE